MLAQQATGRPEWTEGCHRSANCWLSVAHLGPHEKGGTGRRSRRGGPVTGWLGVRLFLGPLGVWILPTSRSRMHVYGACALLERMALPMGDSSVAALLKIGAGEGARTLAPRRAIHQMASVRDLLPRRAERRRPRVRLCRLLYDEKPGKEPASIDAMVKHTVQQGRVADM